ncbi:type IX secretion system membrane protein PorP/SprF [Reichenbachiella agarivorans]|uniref:Type IX secretion system membrane protein PorP/SprF n=1 Tax=Reichenbachiella agarivorans TaxID=2979464 RepID=A0ABY6CR56_9BACT|nr:type IX secretion system membrane protein PorP/SprF [Reichenbachiella agarivorans]UXP31858.1 type IX secretion system membrane protein PorP/SprF [Reichenbachiella agarivorans]
MKKKIIPLLLLALTVVAQLNAQDQRVYSQFFMNPYVLNSAYVGSTGYTTAFGVYRQQWMGLEGAPSSAHISFNTPLENNLSIGAMASNDKMGAINTSAAKATAGYLLQLDKKQYLRIGFSFGGGYTSYDLEPGNDPTLAALAGSGTSFIMADLGASYYYKDLNVGISIPNLLGRNVVSTDGFSQVELKSYENIMLQANYRYLVNRDLVLEPHVIYRFSTVNMPQFEVAAIAHIGHVVWAGLNYRQQYGMAALLGFKIQETWALGFSYEYGNTELEGFSSGSLEVSLGYNIGKKKKNQKQAISFIQNFDKTKKQLDRAEQRRQQLAAQRQKAAEEAAKPAVAVVEKPQPTENNTPATAVVPATTETTPEVVATTTSKEEFVSETLDPNIPLLERTTEAGVWELGATYIQTRADSSKTSTVKWHDALTATPVSDAELPPSTVRKGTHFLELPAGHHVVAGEFEDFQSAEDYSDEIFQMGYHGAIVGYVSALKQYVVVVHKGATMQIAMEEQEVWSQRHNLDHVYILNVLN